MTALSRSTLYSSIPVTLLKEYAYCPMIAYYKMFLAAEPPTESMIYAREKIDRSVVAARLREEGVSGELLWSVFVKSRKLGVHGVVDLVVLNGSRAKAVEVKLQTSRRGLWKRLRHHLVQAAAYAIAVEETLRVVVDEAIVIGLEKGGAARVKTTPAVRSYVAAVAEEVRRLAQSETRPRPTAERAKCRACFYRKVCRATLEEPCTRA